MQSLYLRSQKDPQSKLDAIFSTLCIARHFDILCITESWLGDDISDDQIHLDGYFVYRRDRGSTGGGIVVYVKQDLACHRHETLKPVEAEGLCLSV